MYHIALKILMGDKAKYYGLVFGVTFATLLIAQQVSMFIGILQKTASVIHSIPEADLWVMDPRVRYLEEIEPMRDIELSRVRSVEGVRIASPFYKGMATIRIPGGLSQQIQLMAVDSKSLIGASKDMVLGDIEALEEPASAVLDKNGYYFIWNKEPLTLNKEIELNDHRLVIRGICDAPSTFLTYPVVYLSYEKAMAILPPQRNRLSYILVKVEENQPIEQVAQSIKKATGLLALTKEEFSNRSIQHVLERTGIPINFGITVFLGLLIGIAITAQTFYIFVIENLRQFAAMKAIGVSNKQLMGIVLTQAGVVASIGYSLGVGITSWFFYATRHVSAFKGFTFPANVMIGTGILMVFIILTAVFFSLRKIFKIDPSTVFRSA